jgi:hypothetical protein
VDNLILDVYRSTKSVIICIMLHNIESGGKERSYRREGHRVMLRHEMEAAGREEAAGARVGEEGEQEGEDGILHRWEEGLQEQGA